MITKSHLIVCYSNKYKFAILHIEDGHSGLFACDVALVLHAKT